MFDRLVGSIAETTLGGCVLLVQGVGYRLSLPPTVVAKLVRGSDSVTFYISYHFREPTVTLFAFLSQEERDLFEALIQVSGIGPKMAQNLLGHLSPLELMEYVEEENSVALAKVPGIGRRTAERLIVELRGRQKKVCGSVKAQLVPHHDAVLALVQLGYKQEMAEKRVKEAVLSLSASATLSDVLSRALAM